MSNLRRKSTLADKISMILTAAPSTNLDPENENQDANPLTENLAEEQDFSDSEPQTTTAIRKNNIQILSDIDAKYSGKKSNRKQIFQQDDDDSDGNDYYGKEDDSTEGDEDDDSTEGDEDDDSKDGDEESYEEDGEDVEDEESFPNFKNLDVTGERRKGLHVQNQLRIWENLLEIRIQLQKSLSASNAMPLAQSYETLHEFPEFKKSCADTKSALVNALTKLLELQDVFAARIKDDEEVLSDEEEEVEVPVKKIRKEGDFEKDIADSFASMKGFRDKTVQKWNEKTSLGQKKSNSDVSILKQIEFNLANSQKLIERSQLKRSDFKILGVEEPQEPSNVDIYDDSDFYHQLLRELIEVKSADLTDPVQLGRQWIQLQNLRSKMKRKIDTKATKGRKIRYAIHTKLVNFMAPIDQQLWTEDAKNELYNSLFGKKQICSI